MSDVNYSNRTDLMGTGRAVRAQAATGQTYGQAGAQMAAQRAVPMAAPPTENVPQPVQRPQPGQVVQFGAPTARPNEPITAGANFGAGMNAAQAGIPMMMTANQRAIEELRAIYELFPTEDLGDLLSAYTEELG
jgi:hypothetical protein